MIDTFPVLGDHRGLIVEDFSRFSLSFAEILKRHLPTAKLVSFINDSKHISRFPPEWLDLFERVNSGQGQCAIHPQCLMLSFTVKEGGRMVAIVEGADPVFFRKVHEDWLDAVRATVEREFVLLKQARIDVQTGLLNLWNLYSLLDGTGQGKGLHLILVELQAKRVSFRSMVRYSQKCSTLLYNFFQDYSVLHSMGQSTFALVLPKRTAEAKADVERALVAYLKREGCHKVHIGSSFSGFEEDKSILKSKRILLDEAWTALRHAEKRGPFSFCNYQLLAHPEKHSLFATEQALLRRFTRLWRGATAFSIAQFQSITPDTSIYETLAPQIDRGVSVPVKNDLLVYLDGMDAAAALVWAQGVIDRAGAATVEEHISVGVGYYPCSDFKKAETLLNCRKALLHASFFGEASAVIFDAVSLNISGDIFFGDGDLARAVREYRRGLKIDGRDINLHNSLGVALAMMDKLVPAMQSFENALALDDKNFMALYNLGLAEQRRGRKPEAYAYLEKALANYRSDEVAGDLVVDLRLQLGMLAGDLGKYQQALAYLQEWRIENENSPKAGRVLYHLGQAWHGLGDNHQAMVELQRALKFNEYDDRAMALLGNVYFREGEGDDIALALCQKSVELEPGNVFYRCTLAEVQLQCGMLPEARENLYRCLKTKGVRMKAQILLGRSFMQEGLKKRAKEWFQRALNQGESLPELFSEASSALREVS